MNDNSNPRFISKKKETYGHTKTCIQKFIIIHSSPKVETSQMSISWLMDKQIWYIQVEYHLPKEGMKY